MVQSEEAAFELLVPHEQFAKAIEPTMRDLHNPPPGSLRRIPPLLIGFLPAPFNLWDVAVFCNDAKRRGASIASVGTQMFVPSLRGIGALHHDAVKDRSKLANIMSVCSGHDDRQRDATTVHQQVALAPIFSPDPSGLARQLPAPAVPSSLPRRYSAIATRCLHSRHTPPTRPSTGLRTLRLAAIRDSACEWHLGYRSVRSAALSTDSQCATRKQWPRTPSAHLWVYAHRRVCAHTLCPTLAGAREARARPAAKERPTLPMLATSFSSLVSPSLISQVRTSRD